MRLRTLGRSRQTIYKNYLSFTKLIFMVITAFSSTEISIFRLIESYWFFFNSIIVLYVEDVLGTRGVVIIHFFLNQTDCTRPATRLKVSIIMLYARVTKNYYDKCYKI